MRRYAVVISAILSIVLAPSPVLFAKGSSCTNWPRIMTQYELDHMPAGATLVVDQFLDYTKQAGDGWLSDGIRDYLADLLRTSRSLRVLAGPTAAQGAPKGTAVDYRVGGKFQHVGAYLRIFVALTDGNSGALLRQMEVNFQYPDSKDFFAELAGCAKKIMEATKTRWNEGELVAVKDATSSTRAYENYSKGRQALWSFQGEKSDMAATLFTEVKRIDYRSPLGYIGMMDLYTFQGLYQKERGGQFGTYFQRAEEEMNEMRRLVKQRVPDVTLSGMVTASKGGGYEHRFIRGNAAYAEGMIAMQAGNYGDAVMAFRRAAEAVPEDAMSWYNLYRADTAKGDTAAAQGALVKARSINSCIEG